MTADEFTTFSLRFRSGAVGTVFLSCVAAHGTGPRIEVWGDEGHLALDAEDRLWGARRGEALAELTEPETLTPPPGMEYVSLWGVSFVRLVDHLVQATLDGRARRPRRHVRGRPRGPARAGRRPAGYANGMGPLSEPPGNTRRHRPHACDQLAVDATTYGRTA